MANGGVYVDADDVFLGVDFTHLFDDARLKLQPLCYDIDSDEMVQSEFFTGPAAESSGWIFYFNNNPIVAPPGHRVVQRALERSTRILTESAADELPEIQSTTGPGNLTASFVAESVSCESNEDVANLLVVLHPGSVSR